MGFGEDGIFCLDGAAVATTEMMKNVPNQILLVVAILLPIIVDVRPSIMLPHPTRR